MLSIENYPYELDFYFPKFHLALEYHVNTSFVDKITK